MKRINSINRIELELDINDSETLKLMKALSSETRIELLRFFRNGMDISRLAIQTGKTEASVSDNIKKLEDAGIVESIFQPGSHGVRKIPKIRIKKLIINL